MEITDLILDYPKTHPAGTSDTETESFDINDKAQVIEMINELIPMVLKKPLDELGRGEQLSCGWVIEGVLKEDFGHNFQESDHRDFVKKYVLRNYERAKRNLELIGEGLRSLQK